MNKVFKSTNVTESGSLVGRSQLVLHMNTIHLHLQQLSLYVHCLMTYSSIETAFSAI